MIKAIRIDVDFSSKGEFAALGRFLELLGSSRETATAMDVSNDVTYSAPLAKIAIGWETTKPAAENPWKLAIEVDDPDVAYRILGGNGYRFISDLSEYQTGWRQFVVEVTPGFNVAVLGAPEHWMGMERTGVLHANDLKFAIVVSRFNSFITRRLAEGALDALARLGTKRENIEVVDVPGSFEIPSAARTLAQTRKFDAIICLGCLLRGDTAHYDVIVNEVTRGIGQSAQETGVPHAFGVLTCDTLEQAIDRAGLKMGNKGFEAALAAVEMANLQKAVVGRSSSVVREPKGVAGRRSSVSRQSKNQRKDPKSKH